MNFLKNILKIHNLFNKVKIFKMPFKIFFKEIIINNNNLKIHINKAIYNNNIDFKILKKII
jgi:hypothetical protein